MKTKSISQENVAKIQALFPNAVTEVMKDGKVTLAVDFDVLKQELSESLISEGQERYQMTWPDKKKSVVLANSAIAATLRPCKEESVDFDTTQNLYIEGDNLDVLKLLRETYLGKVKMIYIDPPYNTGNDFVYNDDFSQDSDEYMENSGQYDEQGNRLFQNTESNGRFHTDWLNMIYPRLKVAKDLLSDDGVIFISIDDNEVENLKKICNEIFGESNCCGIFVVNSTPNARDYGHLGKMHEYCVLYAKDVNQAVTYMLPEEGKVFKYMDSKGGYNIHPLYNSNEAFTNMNRPNLYYPFYLYADEPLGNNFYKIGLEYKNEHSIKIYPPKSLKNQVQFVWRWGKEKALLYMNEEIVGYETSPGEFRIVQKMRHDEKIIRSLLLDTKYSSRRGTAEVESIFSAKCFSFPKPLSLLHDFVKIATSNNDIIIDFFSGSATTAHAVMQLNAEDGGKRKFIMIQLSEPCDEKSEAYKAGYKNICEIGKERIRRAGRIIYEEKRKAKGQPTRVDLFHQVMATKEFEQQHILMQRYDEAMEGLDVGFRVLKLDSSNMQDVYYNPSAMTQSLLDITIDNVKPDRSPMDLLFQVMLELGVELSAKIEEKEIRGKKYYIVNDNDIIACFDDNLNNEVITEIAKLQPLYAVFKDKSFATDSVGINNEQIFKTYSSTTTVKVI